MAKFHLVDDESQFRQQSLEMLREKPFRDRVRDYQLISIIGSQSSGKSTLLNQTFGTKFQVMDSSLGRKQTTKGIWISVLEGSPILIFDVQGSDSNQREQRLKIERRNALFALAVSNTLIINIWTHQIGLYKGSQLEILQIILQLNLKLFGTQKPKEIIFVVRDYEQDQETNITTLKENIYKKVVQAWNKVIKPPGKQLIKLEDLFHMNIYFLPHYYDERQAFKKQVAKFRECLFGLAKASDKSQNVPLSDFPQYLSNVWNIVQNEKDINLPAQKIMIANLRCNQIKKQAQKLIDQDLNTLLDKSADKFNENFKSVAQTLVAKCLSFYIQKSQNYPIEEVQRTKNELFKQLQIPIENGYKTQVSILIDNSIKQVLHKFNEINIQERQNSISKFNDIKSQSQTKFAENLSKIAYKQQWTQGTIKQFTKSLNDTIQAGKDKILIDFIKHVELTIRKKIETIVNKALNNKELFIENTFWNEISTEFSSLISMGSNSLLKCFKEIQINPNTKKNQEYFEKSKSFSLEEMKSVVSAKIKDLGYYLNRHFRNDFNNDEKGIPNNWPAMQEEQITQRFKKTKSVYFKSINQFQYFGLIQNYNPRASFIDFSNNKLDIEKQIHKEEEKKKQDLLIDIIKSEALKKKFLQNCQKDYNQAISKHNQKYNGSTPKWIYILLMVIMIDDVLYMIKSPLLMVPVTIIGLLIALLFAIGGKTAGMTVLNTLKDKALGSASGLFTRAAINNVNKKKQ